MKLSKSFFAGFLLLLFYAPHSQAQTATVNWNNLDQVIDGFGVSTTGETSPLTSAQATFFFSTGSGDLGLSLLRTEIPYWGACNTISAACAWEISDMQNAVANGTRVWSTAVSPPAAMKSNGSEICNTGSGNGYLLPGSYSAYATYLSNYVQSLSSLYGISLYALSVQNEPDFCPTTYQGAVWNSSQLDTFIKNNLGPTFVANGLTSTLIVMPETSLWSSFTSYASTTMADSTAAAYVGINAWHDYDSASSITNPYASQGKKFWETEASAGSGYGPSLCGGCWDPSMADGLLWAAIIDNRMAVANANAWNWFWTIDYATSDNSGLIGSDGVTVAKHAYVLGNYAKFVRPGMYRIDATHTPQSGVLVSAYKNSTSGALVIVVINQNSSDVSQTFTLNGTTASSVTPWVTSGSLNLAQQPDVSVSGGSFTYSLPASSISSFVGNTTTASGPPAAPMPPTQLTATAR
jgi:glucuronoarabinoxylan endo-1,4-beta-xylanase